MNYKLVIIALLIFFMECNIAIAESGLETKRIVVMLPNLTYKSIPYNETLWKPKYVEILGIAGPNAEVMRNSPKYAYVTLSIPQSEYNQTVKSLTEKGYDVEGEPTHKLMLNESLSVIGAPYNPGSNTLTGAGSVIAILDTGIDCSHPDFSGCSSDKLLNFVNTFDPTNNTPSDEDGHGTHVASIAAGTGAASNGKYKGVAPNAKLIILKVCRSYEDCPSSNIVKAFDWLFANYGHIDVISLSWGLEDPSKEGCNGQSTGPLREEYDRIMDVIRLGVVVVASAGNQGVHPKSVAFPACMNDTIAVGAVFKRNYDILDLLEGGSSDFSSDVNFHVIVNISGGYNANYEKEWTATARHGTGFYQSIFITSPTTVRVRAEGQWKSRDIWGSWGGWVPGGDPKGDGFWGWNQTITPPSQGAYAILEVAARPIYKIANSFFGWFWTGWDPINESIIVRIYPTLYGLAGNLYLGSGKGPSPQGTVKPNVVAPGVNICAAKASGVVDPKGMICDNNNYIAWSGSSMAAPFVAGLVALLKEYKPTASSCQIKQSIMQGAKGTEFPDFYREGSGVINEKGAADYLKCLINPCSSSNGGGGGGGGYPGLGSRLR